jgi:hypothetical protein
MRTHAICTSTLVLALGLAPLAVCRAQGGHRPPACAEAAAMAPDSLRAYARAVQPAAFEEARRDSAMMVGLVFDAGCHLLHHALGRRTVDQMTVDIALAQLLPTTRVSPWTISGFVGVGHQAHAPIIAWVVLAPPDSVH